MIDKALLERNRIFNDNRYLRVDGSTQRTTTAGGSVTPPTGSSINIKFDYLELVLAFSFAYTSYFKDFTYDTGGNLTSISIYRNSTMANRLFHKVLSYDSGGNLTSVVITRDSDGTRITKALVYDSSENLDTITVTYA